MNSISIPVPSLTSWVPKLVGLLSIAVGILNVYNTVVTPGMTFGQAIKNPVTLALLLGGVLGFVTKQSNVTGGTVAATPEAAARVAKVNGVPIGGGGYPLVYGPVPPMPAPPPKP